MSPTTHLLSFELIGIFDQKTVCESLFIVNVKQYAFPHAILVGKWSNSSTSTYISTLSIPGGADV